MSVKQGLQRLYYMPKPNRWQKGIGAELPKAYKEFWREWKIRKPAAVHYIKQEGRYVRNEETEEVRPVQNIPLPLLYPKELHEGIWGGETIVQGFLKKGRFKRKVPHFWIPQLKKSVLYSEILDTYMKIVVTERTLRLVHHYHGFDHYLLTVPACDLMSTLAVKLKRQMLIALADKTLYPNDPEKCEEVYAKYKKYLSSYTREKIEWYGLTYQEACNKWKKMKMVIPQPLKIQYRAELIAKLKENKIKEVAIVDDVPSSSWLNKLNPFFKSPKTK